MRFTYPGIFLSLCVAVLPFITSRQLFSGATNAKFFLIMGIAIVATSHFAYMLIVNKHPVVFRGRWLLILLGGSVGVLYLTTLTGVYAEYSLFSTYLRSTGVFFLSAVALIAWWAGEFLSERDWSLLRRVIAGSAALFALLSFIGSEGVGFDGRLSFINFAIDGLTIGNSTFAGAFLLLAFIITLIELFRVTSYRGRYVLAGVALVQFLSPVLFNAQVILGNISFSELVSNPLVLLGTAQASSASMFLVIIYIVGLLVFRRFVSTKRELNLIWAGLWLLGIGVALILLFVPGSIVEEKLIEQSSAARPIVWAEARQAIKDRPIFGWGPENFRFAHERYADNRLYLDENVGEVWFDRTHNLFLDTLVTVGMFGTLVFGGLAIYFLIVIFRVSQAGMISIVEANLLSVLIVAHILQLQTAFDTVITYTIMAIVLGYLLSLERQLVQPQSPYTSIPWIQTGLACIFFFVAVCGSVYLIDEYQRQRALYKIFVSSNDREEQIALIHEAMSRTSDFETLRLGSASLARGLFGELSAEEKRNNATIIQGSVEQLVIFGEYWEQYLAAHPDDYRARMNYAYQLLVRTVFGEGDHFGEAKAIIADSYALSPNNPLTYVLDALASLYSGNLSRARERMEEAIALNPDIPFSQKMHEYMEEQARSFPEITVTKIENI